jgi:hypothetical protein
MSVADQTATISEQSVITLIKALWELHDDVRGMSKRELDAKHELEALAATYINQRSVRLSNPVTGNRTVTLKAGAL